MERSVMHTTLIKPLLVAVWLDSSGATAVRLRGGEARIRRIESGVAPRCKTTGGARGVTPYARQNATDESSTDARRKHQFARYYAEILAAVMDADRILVMGPGEAKLGLVKAIRASHGLSPRLRGVHVVSRMTDRQLVAHAREYYGAHMDRSEVVRLAWRTQG
jgi:hypothetical protein